MEAIRKDLNEAQQEAVLNHKGPALIIAGAGSGKTRVLTYRIAYLLSMGVSPSRILALTFTNKAANEMKERIATMVSPDLARNLWMGTFHSLFARILRREAEVLGFPSNFTIYDTIDSRSLVKTIVRELSLDEKIYKPSEVFGRISTAKNNLVTPDVYLSSGEFQVRDQVSRRPRLGEVYDRYVKRCKHFGAMDFDDLLLQTNLLFRDHPAVLDKYREAFDYVLVDEYQDTNYSQYLIVKKLSELHRNLCVVGDDAQSIYSFRGARIENMLNFKNDYPDYRLFKLEQNYRSTQTIVNAANSVIKKNRGQISKEVFSKNENGEPIRVLKAPNDRDEGFMVAGHISDLRFRQQLEHKDFAILYRTNAQSRIFEESLRRMNIPYKVFGSLSFYQRKEIKDLLAYFRLTVNPRDDESLKRIINYPMRGIGKTTLEKLNGYAEKLDSHIWDVLTHLDQVNLGFNKGTLTKLQGFTKMIKGFRQRLPEMEAFDLAYTIASEAGIIRDLQADRTPENVSRSENIEQLLNGIKDYTDNTEREGEMNLGNYLQEVTLMTDMDQEKDEDRNRVTLMTIHSAKGLEFKHLIIAGVEEELFPSPMSTDNPKDLEEERRLFYVALTRAEKSAIITYAALRYKWGIQNACSPSRFIKEIDTKYLELPPDFYPVVPGIGTEGGEKEKFVPEASRKLVNVNQATRSSQSTSTSAASSQPPKDFTPSDPGMIKVGTRVEHPRFGIGEVHQLEGTGSNIKATVLFPIGTKQLLLKFAKLRVVD
ncbi:MAG: ATP-dependent DNA helicase [Bacteroidetes bacterium]|nr:MAG: ATP-dependent DNA helicase [Bacteroidota bacterium]RLD71775.1 MAG: ATP-dependent DNA helicase [Bacteroidota bacterium]RLD92983.1 MAG: ATP-dependent DNA helicase [Bacteroidota bacterium]